VIAIDGAPTMVKVAAQRLGPAKERVEFRVGDFRDLDLLLVPGDCGQLVISSYALHHLDPVAKANVVRRCANFLKPGGWFVNADCIVGATGRLEQRYQELRVDGVVRRADASDPRFGDAARVRAFLDDLEEVEGDQPLPLARDLEILRAAGLRDVDVFWLEHREAVTGGVK
jgi:tRNA (cmo5U34)-methyltransferase